MKIYTKTGDAGETGLWGGPRVPKDDLRIRAYGTVDELNSSLGVALTEAGADGAQALRKRLLRIQGELFQLGAEMATPRGKKCATALIEDANVKELEREIDEMETQLPELKSFILPGGSKLSAWLHLARTVCRRAERELITLHRQDPQRAEILEYFNRLSDYLFVAARYGNALAKTADVPWEAP